MKHIIQYQAKDGKIFNDAETCIEYENLLINAELTGKEVSNG